MKFSMIEGILPEQDSNKGYADMIDVKTNVLYEWLIENGEDPDEVSISDIEHRGSYYDTDEFEVNGVDGIFAVGTEDEMISSLSFKIDPTANYVTSRQSVTYQAQGSNIYQSGSGSRVIRFQLSGTGQYLDPSTVRFMFTLVNNTDDANKNLYPVGGPWSFFRRCRVYSGSGAVLEDIDIIEYTR